MLRQRKFLKSLLVYLGQGGGLGSLLLPITLLLCGPFLPNCGLIICFNDRPSSASCTVKREGHYAAISPACPLSEPYINTEWPAHSLIPFHPGGWGWDCPGPEGDALPVYLVFLSSPGTWKKRFFLILTKVLCLSVNLLLACGHVYSRHSVLCVVLGSTAVFNVWTSYVRTSIIRFVDLLLTEKCSQEDHTLANWDLIECIVLGITKVNSLLEWVKFSPELEYRTLSESRLSQIISSVYFV